MNIATGLTADDRVKVDEAISIGEKIQDCLNDKKNGDIALKRSQQAKAFAVMRKPVKMDGEEIRIPSAELYQRLLSTYLLTGPPDPQVFAYELATVSPALFHDDGRMQKAQLAKQILQIDADIVKVGIKGPAAKVFDGCAYS